MTLRKVLKATWITFVISLAYWRERRETRRQKEGKSWRAA